MMEITFPLMRITSCLLCLCIITTRVIRLMLVMRPRRPRGTNDQEGTHQRTETWRGNRNQGVDGWKQKEGKKGLVGGAENEPFCL